jgi:5-methyltetrahydrofolate--homocysteine methyltransferase
VEGAVRSFRQRIESGRALVADGATGTNLQAAGLLSGGHTEDLLFDHPENILALERQFVEAGSEILLTCTFGATAIRMQGSKYSGKFEEINLRAAGLAREAAGTDGVLVAGSMGPLGKLLKPFGPISFEEAKDAYSQQARALASGGVDLLVIETQFSMDEARAAFEGTRAETDLPVVVSFSYDRGTRTMMGVRPDSAARTFKELGAAMIGVNCGTTLENARAIVEAYAAATPAFPIWVKPNAGLPRMEGTTTVYDVTPGGMGEFARSVMDLGARVVGGCCGSTPAHVQAIAAAVHGVAGAPAHTT